MNLDDFKGVWKEQSGRGVTLSAEVLLQTLRRNQMSFAATVLVGEGVMIGMLLLMAAFFLGFVWFMCRRGIPWTVLGGMVALAVILLGIVVQKLWDRLDQWRRRPRVSDPILGCVEQSLAMVRHEIELWGKKVLWVYLLPMAVGVAAAVINVQWVAEGVRGLYAPLTLQVMGGNVFVFGGGYWLCRWWVRRFYEPRRRELEQLLETLRPEQNS